MRVLFFGGRYPMTSQTACSENPQDRVMSSITANDIKAKILQLADHRAHCVNQRTSIRYNPRDDNLFIDSDGIGNYRVTYCDGKTYECPALFVIEYYLKIEEVLEAIKAPKKIINALSRNAKKINVEYEVRKLTEKKMLAKCVSDLTIKDIKIDVKLMLDMIQAAKL